MTRTASKSHSTLSNVDTNKGRDEQIAASEKDEDEGGERVEANDDAS